LGDVVIVTGAAGGLGRTYALGLANAGFDVVLADIADTTDGVNEVEAAGGTALGVQVDVTDLASTESMATQVNDRFGRIDALVNNAAYYTSIIKKPFDELSVDEWDRCMAVNVRGAWLCARAVSPRMKAQLSGKIVNVSSTTVPTGLDGFLHYVTSKAAIIGFTRSLARELGPWNVAVNTITPDYIAFDRDYDNRQPELAAQLSQQRCFKREVAPSDMLGTVLYLLGDGARMVTGQNLHVNGGRFFS
jgi:3-oxoacyl-[acyl-carrier protein] reductase